MLSVTFLLDKSNNWIESYVKEFIEVNTYNHYNLNICFDYREVQNNDIVFILGYTKILNENFLNSNKLNLVVHESNLPRGKGFSPVQWQILKGLQKIIFTLFEAKRELDSGDIILQKEVLFTSYELFDEIRDIQGRKTLELIGDFLDRYPVFKRKAQVGEETMFAKRKFDDDKLDINKTIKEQFNHFRIANNEEYPLWFELDGNKYNLKITRMKNEE